MVRLERRGAQAGGLFGALGGVLVGAAFAESDDVGPQMVGCHLPDGQTSQRCRDRGQHGAVPANGDRFEAIGAAGHQELRECNIDGDHRLKRNQPTGRRCDGKRTLVVKPG